MKPAQIAALARHNARKAPVEPHHGRDPDKTPEGRPFTQEAQLTSRDYRWSPSNYRAQDTQDRFGKSA